MKIAQISPLWESVPPKLYGGTERIVSYLTEELVRLGHDVTLFASGDSITSARLVAASPEALRLCITGIFNRDAPLVTLIEKAFGSSDEFDILHSHLDFIGFPVARRCTAPVITTLHGRLDLAELEPVFREFSEMPLVSISNAQRKPLPFANWQATVHHGLPRDLYAFHPTPGKYLAFLGRISPEKRPDHAIEIAKRTGIPLRIAAKVDPADRNYFEAEIEPLMSHPLVEFVGEITDEEKTDFLGGAYAMVAPYDWPEPFGLVLIEALGLRNSSPGISPRIDPGNPRQWSHGIGLRNSRRDGHGRYPDPDDQASGLPAILRGSIQRGADGSGLHERLSPTHW